MRGSAAEGAGRARGRSGLRPEAAGHRTRWGTSERRAARPEAPRPPGAPEASARRPRLLLRRLQKRPGTHPLRPGDGRGIAATASLPSQWVEKPCSVLEGFSSRLLPLVGVQAFLSPAPTSARETSVCTAPSKWSARGATHKEPRASRLCCGPGLGCTWGSETCSGRAGAQGTAVWLTCGGDERRLCFPVASLPRGPWWNLLWFRLEASDYKYVIFSEENARQINKAKHGPMEYSPERQHHQTAVLNQVERE